MVSVGGRCVGVERVWRRCGKSGVRGVCFFFQAEDGIRDLVRSRGLGDVYKRQAQHHESVVEQLFAGWGDDLLQFEDDLLNEQHDPADPGPVSYTHLTLPTIYSV